MSYPITCAFSGVQIYDGSEVVVIPIHKNKYPVNVGFYHTIFDFYRPYLHPIQCEYFGDGIFTNAIGDFSTKKIEKAFNVNIEVFLEIITGQNSTPIPNLFLDEGTNIESMVVLKETYDLFVKNKTYEDDSFFDKEFKQFEDSIKMKNSFLETKLRTTEELKRIYEENNNNKEILALIQEHESYVNKNGNEEYSFIKNMLKANGYHIYLDNFSEEKETVVQYMRELMNCQYFMFYTNVMYKPNYTGSYQDDFAKNIMLELNKHREQLLK